MTNEVETPSAMPDSRYDIRGVADQSIYAVAGMVGRISGRAPAAYPRWFGQR
jgi:hypothetical protein